MNSKCKNPGAVALTVAFLFTITTLTRAENQSILLDQLGAVATKQVEGDSLSIAAIPQSGSARLRCAFQRLEGQATPEGLWLSSTTETAKGERFRVVVTKVGREEDGGLGLPLNLMPQPVVAIPRLRDRAR